MIQILPSILTNNLEEYAQKLEKIEQSGSFQDGWIHVDFADKVFVPNQTVGIEALKQHPSNLHIEAHLMVADPEDWAQELIESGVERIIIHLETIENAPDLKELRKQDVEIGLAINLETPVAKLQPFMDTIDLVLVMGIHPGFSGQQFIPEAKEKITEVAKLLAKAKQPIRIEVDGGVTAELVPELEELGASGVIMASKLVEGDINENLEKIWQTYEQKTASRT